MPKLGIEPTRPDGYRILSPARLPVPPLRPAAPMVRGLAPDALGAHAKWEVRRREQEADPRAGPALAARHLKCRSDPADRDEAQLPHRRGIPRARDVHGAEPLERGPARLPVAERQQRMDGVPCAVLLDRARVRGDGLLRGCEQLAIAGDRIGAEEDEIGLLGRTREDAPEAVDEDDDAAVTDRKGVAPQPERVREAEVRREQWIGRLARQEGSR